MNERTLQAVPAVEAKRSKRTWAFAAAVAILVLGAILTLRMGKGTVVVEGPAEGELPEDVAIVLSGGGKQLEITSADNWKISVQPGTYEVHLKGGGDTLQVKEGQISVQRFGKQIVSIRREENTAKPQAVAAANLPQTDVAGSWKIKAAANLAGEAYGGAVDMRASSTGVVDLDWRDEQGQIVQTGIGLIRDGHLLAAWGVVPAYGFCLYKLLPDGKMEGQWTVNGASGRLATETATGGTPGKVEGNYDIRGTTFIHGGEYRGTLSIARLGETYAATWTVPEGSYHGIGLRHGDYLAIAWSVENAAGYGIVDYKLEGNSAQGRWTMIDQTQLSFEVLQRDAPK
jgi:hypothetical protein